MTVATAEPSRLLLKGRTYGLCAELFSPDLSASAREEAVKELQGNLERLGYAEALGHLKRAQDARPSDTASTGGEYVRLFVKGEAPPYETTYDGAGSARGGKMQQLADIAGFYRAFGFQAVGERPDHLAVELEFMALLYVKEAYALLSRSAEGAVICSESRRKFMAGHLTGWLPAFGQKVSEAARLPYFAALAAVVVALAQADLREIGDESAQEVEP
jgi:TorA maturation chaperone TorD